MRFYKETTKKKCKICSKLFKRHQEEEAYRYKKRSTCSESCYEKWIAEGQIDSIRKNLGRRKCEMCSVEFQPINYQQRFCGSKSYRIGCSWKNQQEKNRKKRKDYYTSGGRHLWTKFTKIVSL